jgi:hypothetical protein
LSVVATGLIVPFLTNALRQMSSVTGTASTIAIWALWSIALLSMLAPSSTALTAIRLALPTISVVVGVVAIAVGMSGGVAGALAISLLASLLVMSAEIGNSFIQLAAYGDERRYLLRCPPAMLVVQILSWLVWLTLTIVAINLFDNAEKEKGDLIFLTENDQENAILKSSINIEVGVAKSFLCFALLNIKCVSGNSL